MIKRAFADFLAKKSFMNSLALLLFVGVLLVLVNHSHAQSGGLYTVTWSSTNSGVTSSGGAYTLNAMLSSQGTSTSSGGDYFLGGIWSGSMENWPWSYLPLVVR
jgi:hypothetical protein